jgi:peptidoglycan/xylan/chitin deacetylase (PgdA/CDA1 family)
MHRRSLLRLALAGLPLLAGCGSASPPTPAPAPSSTPLPPAATAAPASPPAPSATPVPAAAPPATATVTPRPAPVTATRPAPPATATPAPTSTRLPPTPAHRLATATPRPAAPTATRPPAQPAPSPAPPAPPGEIVRGNPATPAIALTFDAGAGGAPTGAILAALAEHGAASTFFLTGRWAEQNPDLTRQIHAAGHELANHSYTHPDFRTLSNEQIAQEIISTERLIGGLTGASTRPWFRFPYGARDARTRAAVAALGYTSVYWSLDSLDSVGAPKTPQFLYDRIVGNAGNGAIVLAHVGSEPTAAALPRILAALRERGFRLVTVSQLVG